MVSLQLRVRFYSFFADVYIWPWGVESYLLFAKIPETFDLVAPYGISVGGGIKIDREASIVGGVGGRGMVPNEIFTYFGVGLT